jgi:transcriptional regulator with XRE-family HTH domain
MPNVKEAGMGFEVSVFAPRIKALRAASGLSLAAVGKKVGISAVSLHQLEKGMHCPSAGTLVELADCFDVSLDYLVGRSDEPALR